MEVNNTIKLAEKPFYGFQGEGSSQGRNSLFIRFRGCNLACSLCDSKYANKGIDSYSILENDLLKMINNSSNVVFTGGEPLLYRDKIVKYVNSFKNKSFEIETNGTLNKNLYPLFKKGVHFNVSPKENISQSMPNIDTTPILLKDIKDYDKYCIKFLLSSDKNLSYIRTTIENYNLPLEKIYIQPVGVNREAIYEIVKKYYNTIIANGWSLSARLHVLFFNDKRGV